MSTSFVSIFTSDDSTFEKSDVADGNSDGGVVASVTFGVLSSAAFSSMSGLAVEDSSLVDVGVELIVCFGTAIMEVDNAELNCEAVGESASFVSG